ncbi:SCO family protein [Aquiflexum gelatinilyticum]|uniref:SCO family protein n=1 Tax=Aquiflexum gelatinilyticum TaxID=2961943 RepID=A0A9X2T220_9BACT|nr:SCO family protein [Aquiflexum gelatinilyticum]MCR9016371.1 SCO family protein [Aquiflexum gelatinilyticum]
MKRLRILQGLVLVCILLVPVVIFLFLKTFGNNQYDIPVFFQNGVEDPLSECKMTDSGQHYIPGFTLLDQNGQSRGSKEMAEKITIVDFFFTSCPSICPVMSTELERVDDAFRNDDQIRIYSISIDPEYDTPEVLAEYAQTHMATAGKWFFLTGDKSLIYNLARCGFILPTIDGEGQPEEFVHSDKFVLVDGQGRIRGYYSGTNREDVDKLILETKILLHGTK